MRTLAPLFVALVALTACAGGTRTIVEPPTAAVRAYVDAVRAGDVEAVYAMLDEATRAEVDLDALRASYAENEAEAAAQAEALEASAGDPRARAELTLASGEVVTLVLEEGGFRVAGGFLDAVAPATPEDAVEALRHALLRRSLPALLRILSRETRAGIDAEIERLLEETADPLDLEIHESESRATIRLGSGRVLELVREAGEWRIVDLH